MITTDKGTIILTEQEYRTLTNLVIDLHQYLVEVKRTLGKSDLSTHRATMSIRACDSVIVQFGLKPKTLLFTPSYNPLFVEHQ